jgi:hypothetical protein
MSMDMKILDLVEDLVRLGKSARALDSTSLGGGWGLALLHSCLPTPPTTDTFFVMTALSDAFR